MYQTTITRPRDASKAPLRRAQRRPSNHLYFWAFCIASGLDFRSKTAGGTIQLVLFIVSTLAFTVVLLTARRPDLTNVRLLYRVTFSWWLYLLVSLPVALYWSVSPMNYFKAVVPSLLMGESLILGLLMIAALPANVEVIMEATYWACLISSVVFFVNGLFFLGYNLNDARFRITSPLLTSLVAISLWRYCWRKDGRQLLYLLSFGFALIVMYFSVTRTYIIAVACALLTFVPVHFLKRPWYSRELRRTTAKRLGGLSVVLVALVAGVLLAFPSTASNWVGRTSTIGETDPTALSRLAESAGELEQMQTSATRFLIGSGIGSDHSIDNVYLKGVAAWAGDDTINDAIWEPGHVLWPYQFYATGIFLGFLLPGILLLALWKGVAARDTYLPFVAASAIAGIFAESTFGNILGARSGGTMLGLLLAVALSRASIKGEPSKAIGADAADAGHVRPTSVRG